MRYHLRITEHELQRSFERTTQNRRLKLTSLHPYYNYIISVAAETVAVGPYSSTIRQRTQESGT